MWTWGEPWGDFSMQVDRTPRKVPGAVNVAKIVCGAFHNLALDKCARLACLRSLWNRLTVLCSLGRRHCASCCGRGTYIGCSGMCLLQRELLACLPVVRPSSSPGYGLILVLFVHPQSVDRVHHLLSCPLCLVTVLGLLQYLLMLGFPADCIDNSNCCSVDAELTQLLSAIGAKRILWQTP